MPKFIHSMRWHRVLAGGHEVEDKEPDELSLDELGALDSPSLSLALNTVAELILHETEIQLRHALAGLIKCKLVSLRFGCKTRHSASLSQESVPSDA